MHAQQALLVATMLTLATALPSMAQDHRGGIPHDWPTTALCTTKATANAITAKPPLR